MPDQLRPSLIIAADLLDRKAAFAKRHSVTDAYMTDQIVLTLSALSSNDLKRWHSRLGSDRQRVRRSQAMSSESHAALNKLKDMHGYPVSLLLEIGILAFTESALALDGPNHDEATSIYERSIKQLEEAQRRLSDLGAEYFAYCIATLRSVEEDFEQRYEEAIRDRAGQLVRQESKDIVEAFANLTDDERARLVDLLMSFSK